MVSLKQSLNVYIFIYILIYLKQKGVKIEKILIAKKKKILKIHKSDNAQVNQI